MKLRPKQTKRMKRISKSILDYLNGIAANGGKSRSPAKVAASRANIAEVNRRRSQRSKESQPNNQTKNSTPQ